MGITHKLGFFAFTVGPSVYSGQASANWLFSDAPSSLKSFVRDCASGDIDLTVEVHHIVATATQVPLLTDTTVSRELRLRYFADAARLAGHKLHGFTGLVFACFGGVTDTGKSAVYDKVPGQPGRWIPACVFDELAPHNMVCHEVCHVLGFEHPFWLADSQNPFGEYADPYCVMGFSAGTQATFPAPQDPASGINATAALWTAAGPALSPTTHWRFTPTFPQAAPWMRLLPANPPDTTLILRRAGTVPGNWPYLVAIPASGGGWWTLEYRAALDWDRGLDQAGPTVSSSPGIVIHRISTIGQGVNIAGFPRINAVQYEHTLPFPGIGDDDWANADFGVQVLEVVPNGLRVRVGKALAAPRSVRVDVDQIRGAEARGPAGTEWIPLTGPDCNGATWPVERVSAPVTVELAARTTGFEDPRFSFSINGVALGTTAPSTVTEGNTTSIPGLQVQVPTSRFSHATVTRTLAITWSKTGNRLTLNIPSGQGLVRLPVRVAALSLAGGPVQIAELNVEAETASIELSADAQASLERCLRRLAQEAFQLYVEVDIRPKKPGPIDGPDWSQLRGARLLAALMSVSRLEETHRDFAMHLRLDMAKELGVSVRQLEGISRLAVPMLITSGDVSAH